jgi:hypothetical protein
MKLGGCSETHGYKLGRCGTRVYMWLAVRTDHPQALPTFTQQFVRFGLGYPLY